MINNYQKLVDIQSLLAKEVIWHDSVIQEFYLVAGICQVATEAGVLGSTATSEGQTARLLIGLSCCGGSMLEQEGIYALDVVLRGLRSFVFQGVNELSFNVTQERHGTCLDLSFAMVHDRQVKFIADEIDVLLMSNGYLGAEHRLGFEFPIDSAQPAEMIDNYWRQCKSCNDAWVENPGVKYSRCPGCGSITKLVT